MKKRVLSILLALCMVLTLLPTAALATEPTEPTAEEPVALTEEPVAEEPNVISVTINGTATEYTTHAAGWNAAVGEADGTAVTVQLLANWTAAPASDKDCKTSFGTGDGFGNKGYLHVPGGKTITLDLNGHTLDRGLGSCTQAVSEGKVISVNGTLTLTDSGATGTITGAYNSGGSAVDVQPSGTFTMQGGSITGNNATADSKSPAAGGVYVAGSFTMTGGSITGNNATSTPESMPAAGGVLVATGALTVGGTAQITGNKLTDGTGSNVLLQTGKTITCSTDTPLASGATIGVTTETAPESGKPVTITGENSSNYSSFFSSDNAKYEIQNSGTSGRQVVQLQLSTEQFTLPKGQTYYFDLSSEAGNIGTINIAVPDPTLHYVPFTYAGTVNAYSLHSRSADGNTAKTDSVTADGNTTDPNHAIGYKSDRSLFVAEYNVSHTKTWSDLNTASLIFGKTFDENYKLRSLSAGIWDSHSGSSLTTNEWDRILGKSGLTSPIKNWNNIYSWGQDTDSSQAGARTIRGSQSVSYCNNDGVYVSRDVYGWRPALEVLKPATLGTDGLKAVTLNLNGGSFNSKTDALNIVCAGTTFKAPSGTGLTPPSDKVFDKWNTAADGNGTSYEAGATGVPNSVTKLYAQWLSLPKADTPTTATFAATGADSGTVTASDSDKYSIDGGSTYTAFTGETATITGGITTTNGVWVVKKGDNINTCDSEPLKIPVTQATAPTVGKTDCTTSASNDGTMTGVTSAMEYRKGSDTTYTDIIGTTVTGLAPATYHVRVKAAGTVLASADVGVTIGYNSGGSSSGGGSGGSSSSGGGGSTPTLVTAMKAGGILTASNLDQLVSGQKALTVTGTEGAKLVFDTDALRGINAQTSGSVKVDIKDVSDDYPDTHGGKTVFSLTVTSGGKSVSDFGGKVTISLPYTLKDGEKAEDVTVWHLADDGTMTEIPATYDPKTGLATATVNHFSQYVVGVAPWVNPFTDVQAGEWCYDAVKFVHKNGLFSGVTATAFAPNATMTRAMLWMVLARQDGRDTTGGSPWYEIGMSWAMETGISDGTNPMGNVTREQLVTMLWRYAGSPVLMDYPGLSSFADAGDIAAYTQQAMAWAHQKGLVQGDGATLKPKQNASRAQVAAILMRYCENVAK